MLPALHELTCLVNQSLFHDLVPNNRDLGGSVRRFGNSKRFIKFTALAYPCSPGISKEHLVSKPLAGLPLLSHKNNDRERFIVASLHNFLCQAKAHASSTSSQGSPAKPLVLCGGPFLADKSTGSSRCSHVRTSSPLMSAPQG